ncbi:trichohyalin-like [Solenopsis invicta]|uniref:trichohyalin-like n=1 Tax=Solenopsis invicta TaxID=13686 RepID=UPI00193DDA9E|nr:trichohyalin-like [Solenopsis invicta]
MMKRFRKYLEKKELSLSADKSKVLVFENGRGRRKKREWKWKEENIEKVKEIRYLGYTLQKNGGAEKHTRERLRRATIAMKRTWSIGERIFKEDFRRRIKMFEALVGSVALYGAEVWGWRDKKTLDGIKRKYAKWILNLDRGTPNYILLEETKMEEIRIQAIKRALRYEEKARQSGKKIVKECIRDLEKRRPEAEEGKWERKRKKMLEEAGINKEQLRRERETGNEEITENILKELKTRESRRRQQKINESRYNTDYKAIIPEERSKYLEGRMKKKDRCLIARYRCGNETRGSQYWREEAERRCRICKREEESLYHMIKECEATKSEMTLEEIIGEEGKGLQTMKRIEKVRMETTTNEKEERENSKKKEAKES